MGKEELISGLKPYKEIPVIDPENIFESEDLTLGFAVEEIDEAEFEKAKQKQIQESVKKAYKYHQEYSKVRTKQRKHNEAHLSNSLRYELDQFPLKAHRYEIMSQSSPEYHMDVLKKFYKMVSEKELVIHRIPYKPTTWWRAVTKLKEGNPWTEDNEVQKWWYDGKRWRKN